MSTKGRMAIATTGLEVKDEAKYPQDCAEKLDRNRMRPNLTKAAPERARPAM